MAASRGGGGGGGQQQAQESSMPQWAPEQRPYLFGGETWQPQMPLWNPFAVNYAGGLMGGHNPGYGPQGPMGFGGLLGQLGGGGQQLGGGAPWYQDPAATPQSGGLAGLLGYGQGAPPPPLMNSPFFGHGVHSPENLHQRPGSGLPQPPPPEPEPEPQQSPIGPPPWARRRTWGDEDPFANWWDEPLSSPTAGLHHTQIGNANRAHDAFLTSISGRNINDLTPEERAWLGL